MLKKMLCLAFLAAFLLTITSCAAASGKSALVPENSSGVTTAATEDSRAEPSQSEALTATGNSEIIGKGIFNDDMVKFLDKPMYLYSENDFKIDGAEAKLELYVYGIVIEENGEPMLNDEGQSVFWDDSSLWSLLVRQGDYVYPLISKQRVQLGNVKYCMQTDSNDLSSILAIIKQNVINYVYEYKYDSQRQVFIKEKIY